VRNYELEIKQRVEFVRNVVEAAGANGIVYGNSGGKDCTLVGIICKMACDNTVGIIMPCGSKRNYEIDKTDAEAIGKKFGIATRLIDLSDIKTEFVQVVGEKTELKSSATANIAPRLRMTALYTIAASENRLVAGTGNRSEAYMGYFTKWGDGAYDFNPISDLTVTEIYEFLRFLNAPDFIISKAPSAGLFDGQTDESEMGVSYSSIDKLLLTGETNERDKAIIEKFHKSSEHKRKNPSSFLALLANFGLLGLMSAVLLLASFAHSGEYWNLEPGESSMKMLSMPIDPRSAALAGAGIASSRSAGEAFRNPVANASANSTSVYFSKTQLSSLIGASRMSMLAHTTLASWHLSTGIESLNYDEIQGRTEDGLTADGLSFSPATVAAQIGAAKKFSSLSAGLNFRYVNQNIDDYYANGFLFDAGARYDFLEYFAFGAIFNNLGFINTSTGKKDVPPLSVQAGITANCPLPLGFTGAISTDLHRRNDAEEEFRLGLEIMYSEVFSARFGYPISDNENNALSAGFALGLGFASIEYAYQNRKALEANHIFGIGLYVGL